MSNPVKEYLIAIGLDLNKIKLQNTEAGIKKVEGLLQKTKKASDFLQRGLAGVALSMMAVAGASAKLITSLAKQDQSFETMAQKMFVSRKSVNEFQYAVKSLGASLDEIQFNPTLMRQYKELISDSRLMGVGKGYEGAMGSVRSFLFEFARLKQESLYLLQWIGFSIIKNLHGPLEKARQTVRSINDFIVKNMPKIGDMIGKVIFNAKNFAKSIVDFFGGIAKEIGEFWQSLPDWAKKFIEGAGLIGAIFIGMQNPLIFVSTLLAGIALLIDDFQKHLQGKKALLGEFWDNLIKWIKSAKKTVLEWKDNSIKWIENFVQICKTKIPELKALWENVSKWIEENGTKSIDSLVKLIGGLDDFFSKMAFYWSNIKADPGGFLWKISTGQAASEYDSFMLDKQKGERRGDSSEVQTLGNVPGGKWDSLISEMARKYGISPKLLRAVMMKESGGDPSVVSNAGAQGLMQLMPETAKDLGVSDPFDPRQNLEGGAKYLSQLKKRYNGDTVSMLRAYNWGMGNVDALNAGKISTSQIPAETINYVNSIFKIMGETAKREAAAGGAKITPIIQARDNTCGVVSVAMANNAINGNNALTEDYILKNYNFRLLAALNGTNKNKNIRWKDLKNDSIGDEQIAEMARASSQGLPFIFAANGPKFSPSGYGHFLTGQSVDMKNKIVTYVNPANGQIETATFDELKKAPKHRDGNAVLVPYQIQKPKPKAPAKKAAPAAPRPKGNDGVINLSKDEARQGQANYWRYQIQKRLEELNPLRNLHATNYKSNSVVNFGGINMTINTNSTDPQAIGNAVAKSLQTRINYFALNRGLNLS